MKKLGLFRISLGVVFLIYYLGKISSWSYYYSGLMTGERFALFESPFLFDFFSFILFSSLISFTFGFKTRLSHLIFLLVNLLFFHANNLVIHEPQPLMNIYLLIGVFLPLGDYFSLDQIFGKNKISNETDSSNKMIVQMMILFLVAYYFIGGIKKLPDPLWLSGDAAYYLLKWDPVKTGINLGHLLESYPLVGKLITYVSLFFEILYPLFLLVPRKSFVFLLGVGFHLLIILFLRVGSMGYALIPVYFLLLEDSDINFFKGLKLKNLLTKNI